MEVIFYFNDITYSFMKYAVLVSTRDFKQKMFEPVDPWIGLIRASKK